MSPTKKAPKPNNFFPARLAPALALRGVPLAAGSEIMIRTESEHLLFIQLAEAYRVIDLLARQLDAMIESYSKYRTREMFRDVLTLRFFEGDAALAAKLPPQIQATLLAVFNRLHELRLKLAQIDTLPFTVKEEITAEIAVLTRLWEELCALLKSQFAWELAEISAF